MKKYLIIVSLVILIGLSFSGMLWAQAKGNPPVITASFAVEKGYYGYAWKIYIEAEDPDGDMSRIAGVVHQAGYGHYPTDWIVVKSPYRKQIKGYIQWNTFSRRASYLREWTNITLTISVFDKAGNESNEIVFPFEFVSGAHRKAKPPVPFNQDGLPRLGYIQIDLFEPTLMGGDGQRDQ